MVRLEGRGKSVLMHNPQYMCNILTTAFDYCVCIIIFMPVIKMSVVLSQINNSTEISLFPLRVVLCDNTHQITLKTTVRQNIFTFLGQRNTES